MPRYELKDKYMFVDAYDVKHGNRVPDIADCNCPHIADKSQQNNPNDPIDYLLLNDTAGFIARFIVMGVNTDLIPQIVLSEFGPALGGKIPATLVNDVLNKLYPAYLKQIPDIGNGNGRRGVRPYQAPTLTNKPAGPGNYDLDFRSNWFGTGWFKL